MFRAGILSWQRIDHYDLCRIDVGQRLCSVISQIQAGKWPKFDIHWGDAHFLSFIIGNIDWIMPCISTLLSPFNEPVLIDFYHRERKVSGAAESERSKTITNWNSPTKEGSLVIHSFYSGRCPVLRYVVNDVTLSFDSEQTCENPGTPWDILPKWNAACFLS